MNNMKSKSIKYNNLNITFYYDNLNIHIDDSYLIEGREAVASAIQYIQSTTEYKEFVKAGFSRTTGCLINEWLAHNILYKWGYQKARTGSVDLDQNESKFRKFIYFILTFFK